MSFLRPPIHVEVEVVEGGGADPEVPSRPRAGGVGDPDSDPIGGRREPQTDPPREDVPEPAAELDASNVVDRPALALIFQQGDVAVEVVEPPPILQHDRILGPDQRENQVQQQSQDHHPSSTRNLHPGDHVGEAGPKSKLRLALPML